MADIIATYPDGRLSASPDLFTTLANSIVGQQISVVAADAIWARLKILLQDHGGFTPQSLLSSSWEELRGCGLSLRKIEYLQGIAQSVDDGTLSTERLESLDDGHAIALLSSIRGIGRWTSEMILMFHLERPDVLPLDDIALVRAAASCYGWPRTPELKMAAQYKIWTAQLADQGQQWVPYRSVASWYLWRTQDAEPVVY